MSFAHGQDIIPLVVRFWTKVRIEDGIGGCWRWHGPLDTGGYGHLKVAGREQKAHRLAYEQLVGPIPAGMTIDHLCRVRECVNPAHLDVVTPHENWRRGESPTALRATQTHCLRGHELYGDNLATTNVPEGKSRRVCRTCSRMYQAAYRARKRAKREHA